MQVGLGFLQNQSQSQKMSQTQIMKLGQNQIQSLKILSCGIPDLRKEIYDFAEKNPALEIESDNFQEGVLFPDSKKEKNAFDKFSDYENYSNVSHYSEQKSDDFQNALESNEDNRESLTSHLFNQLKLQKLTNEEYDFCIKLIENLDSKGFHKFAPVSLLDKNNKNHDENFLNKCIDIIQRLEPVGLCCTNIYESLYIQAKILSKKDENKLALFILKEHFDFLNPPQIQKIQKKVNNFLSTQKKLQFANSDQVKSFEKDFVSEREIEEALLFIKKLDPNPSRNFYNDENSSLEYTNFVQPDVFVEKKVFENESDTNDENHIFSDDKNTIFLEYNQNHYFSISLKNDFIPSLKISKSFEKFTNKLDSIEEKSEQQKLNLDFSKQNIQKAKIFIDSIEFRNLTIIRASKEIVNKQILFFEKGPRYLVPFLQKDLAKIIGVDNSTISRLANEKYLACEWGVFPFSYFFTNSLNVETEQNQNINKFEGNEVSPTSKEGVKFEIEKLLKEHKEDKKPLSDQKISDLLAEKGIKIARRTVAKYRAELKIDSSYLR